MFYSLTAYNQLHVVHPPITFSVASGYGGPKIKKPKGPPLRGGLGRSTERPAGRLSAKPRTSKPQAPVLVIPSLSSAEASSPALLPVNAQVATDDLALSTVARVQKWLASRAALIGGTLTHSNPVTAFREAMDADKQYLQRAGAWPPQEPVNASELARQCGISGDTALRTLEILDYPRLLPGHVSVTRRMATETYRQSKEALKIKLMAEGAWPPSVSVNASEESRQHGVPRETVRRVLRELGFPSTRVKKTS